MNRYYYEIDVVAHKAFYIYFTANMDNISEGFMFFF